MFENLSLQYDVGMVGCHYSGATSFSRRGEDFFGPPILGGLKAFFGKYYVKFGACGPKLFEMVSHW